MFMPEARARIYAFRHWCLAGCQPLGRNQVREPEPSRNSSRPRCDCFTNPFEDSNLVCGSFQSLTLGRAFFSCRIPSLERDFCLGVSLGMRLRPTRFESKWGDTLVDCFEASNARQMPGAQPDAGSIRGQLRRILASAGLPRFNNYGTEKWLDSRLKSYSRLSRLSRP
jgi:hypothetical protein